jgi:hypothetical protein
MTATVNLTPIVYAALGIKVDGFKTKQEILDMFNLLKAHEEIIKDAQSKLRDKMFEVAEKAGEKDEKGSTFMRLPNGLGWKKEARNPAPVVNYEAAMELMRKKGLNHRITLKKTIDEAKMDRVISLLENTAPDFVTKQEVVEDEDIEKAFIEQEITDAEFSSIVTKGQPTYALKMIVPK